LEESRGIRTELSIREALVKNKWRIAIVVARVIAVSAICAGFFSIRSSRSCIPRVSFIENLKRRNFLQFLSHRGVSPCDREGILKAV
jgi:hypothetical protein